MYDAIIVGARCAGAPTAMLLARKGYRVLAADRASFPSDTISTHIIWPHGAEIMERWGVLDRLAATGCLPVALDLLFDVGPFALKGGVVSAHNAVRCFPTHDGLTLIAVLWAHQQVRGGPRGHRGPRLETARVDSDCGGPPTRRRT